MEYRFNFTSSHKDLVDCYNAIRNSNSGLSDWSRFFVFCLGIMWLLGFLFGFQGAEHKWQPWLWLVLGVTIVWKTGIKPYLVIRCLKRSNDAEQPIKLEFTSRQIYIISSDDSEDSDDSDEEGVTRKWEEVESVRSFGAGVCVWLTDKTMNWIPNRAFESKAQKDQFVLDVRSTVEKLVSSFAEGS